MVWSMQDYGDCVMCGERLIKHAREQLEHCMRTSLAGNSLVQADETFLDKEWPPPAHEVWMDSDSDGLRDEVRTQWPVLAEALDKESSQ